MLPDLLGQMSSAARDDVLRDPRWEDYARGALAEPEEADLLARARAAGIDEETIEALGPRTPSFDERMAQAALAALARKTPEKEAAAAPAASKKVPVGDALADNAPANKAAPDKALANDVGANKAPANDALADNAPANKAAPDKALANDTGTNKAPAKDAGANKAPANDASANKAPANDTGANKGAGGRVIPLWSRAPLIAGVSFALAAAAAAMLWIRAPTDLPAFQMTVEGGAADVRGPDGDKGGAVRVGADNRLVVTVRPDVSANRQLAARAFVYGPPKAFEWPSPLAVSNAGSVRLIARAGDVFEAAPAGRFALCVVVGDEGALPKSAGDSPPPPSGPGFVTVCRDLEWSAGGAGRR